MFYEELHGIGTSELHIKTLMKKYVKSDYRLTKEKENPNEDKPKSERKSTVSVGEVESN